MTTPQRTLASGKIDVGNSSNAATPVTLTGVVAVDSTGLTSLAAGTVLAGSFAAGSIATADLADLAVTDAKLAASTIKSVSVTITNAQLKALRATPISLVAAPGAGKVLRFLGATLKRTTAANTLTESAANLVVHYTDASGFAVSQVIEATGFIDGTAAVTTNALPAIDQIVAYTASANAALVIHNNGAGEYGANAALDATLVVNTTYQVVTI